MTHRHSSLLCPRQHRDPVSQLGPVSVTKECQTAQLGRGFNPRIQRGKDSKGGRIGESLFQDCGVLSVGGGVETPTVRAGGRRMVSGAVKWLVVFVLGNRGHMWHETKPLARMVCKSATRINCETFHEHPFTPMSPTHWYCSGNENQFPYVLLPAQQNDCTDRFAFRNCTPVTGLPAFAPAPTMTGHGFQLEQHDPLGHRIELSTGRGGVGLTSNS